MNKVTRMAREFRCECGGTFLYSYPKGAIACLGDQIYECQGCGAQYDLGVLEGDCYKLGFRMVRPPNAQEQALKSYERANDQV